MTQSQCSWMNCSGCYQHLSYLLRIKASKRVVESHFKECVKTLKTSMKSPTDENLVEAVALLSQRFTKFKNKFYKKLRGNGTQANGDSNNSNFSSSDTYLQSGRLEESVDNEPKFSPSDFEELKVCSEYETLVKSVRMLSFGTQRLDNILIIQKNDLKGLGYLRYQVSFKGKSLVFAGASEQQNLDNILDSSNSQTKRKKKPADVNTMGTKWIFKNKIDEMGNVTQNKAQLISQGYSSIKGVDFGETFTLVARLESIRLLLGLACFRRITLYQMDVKSTFLNGFIAKEVSVA
ncbi:Copia protein [Cucumis melo var. makuwa]|uniref:Copia protein n=1 Tax=Cucumis melo var. makuwa TaxID=1194695 RepID=A0A5A7TA07_CUCMM|nr:Copia protein [Cucumis melo var. makuwa]